jgi:hypothetical protein
LRAQRRNFAGFPFDRPRRAKLVGGTLIAGDAMDRPTGCQMRTAAIMNATMTANTTRLVAIVAAILIAAALRLVPHPPNFTPIGAIALFGGAYLGRSALAFAAPIAALLLSDIVLGFYPEVIFVYLSVALVVLIGWTVSKRKSALRVGAAALASSVLFYLVTNFGVWLMMDYYPKTLAGLLACYAAAIPFFQNTVAGDLFYAALLFGGFALLERSAPGLRPERSERPA